MKIKKRTEILDDIIRDAHKHPTGWHATFGKNTRHHTTDTYIFHRKCGIYLLKEYQKNPFHTRGVGAKLARKIDDDILTSGTSHKPTNFGIIQGDIPRIMNNIKRGIPPTEILTAALHGKNLGIQIPVKGNASHNHDRHHKINEIMSPCQHKLDESLQKMYEHDRLTTGYS